jgi:6-pyruvoyltetrahydropterin/6-carboxytetrahydropterin synthase
VNNIYFFSTKKLILGSCAFRQPFAESHCKFIHGYLLYVKFWFECNELDKNNWVVDFGSFKKLKDTLENKFDHKTCISADDPELHTFKELDKNNLIRLEIFENGVGIEKFAEYCYDVANKYIRNITNERCWVVKCELWEHKNNSAIVLR